MEILKRLHFLFNFMQWLLNSSKHFRHIEPTVSFLEHLGSIIDSCALNSQVVICIGSPDILDPVGSLVLGTLLVYIMQF